MTSREIISYKLTTLI